MPHRRRRKQNELSVQVRLANKLIRIGFCAAQRSNGGAHNNACVELRVSLENGAEQLRLNLSDKGRNFSDPDHSLDWVVGLDTSNNNVFPHPLEAV
jgi:hypothetical protein